MGTTAPKLTEDSLYHFIKVWLMEHNYPPSIREMARGFGYKSCSQVHRVVGRLVDRGLLVTVPRRGIYLA